MTIRLFINMVLCFIRCDALPEVDLELLMVMLLYKVLGKWWKEGYKCDWSSTSLMEYTIVSEHAHGGMETTLQLSFRQR